MWPIGFWVSPFLTAVALHLPLSGWPLVEFFLFEFFIRREWLFPVFGLLYLGFHVIFYVFVCQSDFLSPLVAVDQPSKISNSFHCNQCGVSFVSLLLLWIQLNCVGWLPADVRSWTLGFFVCRYFYLCAKNVEEIFWRLILINLVESFFFWLTLVCRLQRLVHIRTTLLDFVSRLFHRQLVFVGACVCV